MKDAFEKLFRAVHQFKKLNVSDRQISMSRNLPVFMFFLEFTLPHFR